MVSAEGWQADDSGSEAKARQQPPPQTANISIFTGALPPVYQHLYGPQSRKLPAPIKAQLRAQIRDDINDLMARLALYGVQSSEHLADLLRRYPEPGEDGEPRKFPSSAYPRLMCSEGDEPAPGRRFIECFYGFRQWFEAQVAAGVDAAVLFKRTPIVRPTPQDPYDPATAKAMGYQDGDRIDLGNVHLVLEPNSVIQVVTWGGELIRVIACLPAEYLLECRCCQKQFLRRAHNQRFCSARCRAIARPLRHHRPHRHQ